VGATEIKNSVVDADRTYASTTGAENALLVSGGSSTLSDITVTKSGSGSGENADFYGTNAAILVTNGANLAIDGGTIETNGAYANGMFVYGTGTATISDMTIKTSSNNSGGVMVTGGGTLHVNNSTVETQGGSSAAIRSDRGGGTLDVNGGSYTANGQGSPAIYSTADIVVNDATLVSTSAEGIVIEGKNSVSLNNVKLTDTNTTLNGNSTTYKNVFIYQSMSGDASVGTGNFTAKNSTIVTNKGDSFFITNTTAVITLENNSIVNNDSTGAFLRAQAGKWGSSGSNGGIVTLTAAKQGIIGDIVLDNISTLSMSLSSGSYYKGTINGANTAKSISVTLDADSVVVLSGDSYITELKNADSTNSNIYSNGYKLFVNGTEVSVNTGAAPEYDGSSAGATNVATVETTEVTTETVEDVSTDGSASNTWIYWAIGGLGVLMVAVLIVVLIFGKKNKQNSVSVEMPSEQKFRGDGFSEE